MRRICLVLMLSFGLVFVWSVVVAEEGFYVIPVKKQNYAPIPKTGKTTSWATGDDGDLQIGVAWPNPRFIDNGDGTVMDKLTDLVWLKKDFCSPVESPQHETEMKTWTEAIAFANSLHDGWTGDGYGGDCDLSDGSSAGDWRVPNVRELLSLVDYGNFLPSLPDNFPIIIWQVEHWTSTPISEPSCVDGPCPYLVNWQFGVEIKIVSSAESERHYTLLVRGGNK